MLQTIRLGFLDIQTTQSLKIADFDEVKVSNANATFETFTTAEGGTKFNVGSGATLTLNEVVINGQNNAIVLDNSYMTVEQQMEWFDAQLARVLSL